MPYGRYRRYRGRRSTRPRSVVQSYKKVLNYAGASRAAATEITFTLSTGVDSVAAGQTGPTDTQVPTGSVIKYIEIQYARTNLVSQSAFENVSIQRLHAGQTAVSSNVIGGSSQRNQVHFQMLRMLGANQNNNSVYRFKVPKKYQRVREGDSWVFSEQVDVVHANAVQVIYKFYR